MAGIKDIASKYKVDLDINHNPSQLDAKKPEGRIRRAWLPDIEKENTDETGFKQGLNGVKTGFINPVLTPLKQDLNPIYQPYSETGFKQGLNGVKDLRGNPLKVVSFLTIRLSLDEPYTTDPLSITDIADNLKLSKESVKTAIKFLIKNKVASRLNSKPGLYGWTSYRLKESFVDVTVKQGLNRVQIGGILSSSINTTTLPGEWNCINFEPLQKIGFSVTQLKQLYEKKSNTPEIVQSSIDHFAFGLEHNEKTKSYKDPLNVLMGVLRKGQAWLEPNYESEQDMALKALIECKKRQKERHEGLIKELTDLEFPDWVKTLPDSEKQKIVPEHVCKLRIQAPVTAALRLYFVEQILMPRLKEEKLL